ncbi:hypothetical protein HYX05_00715 [Candidatus Woesearchaeota archaeon]|nr:hypothetical protein [Candidatus Woesearchaeota archaeon]
MGWLNKKSEAATTLLVILVIVFLIGWLVNVNQRECKRNSDCSSESYCGSDFSCHSYPTIQKTVVQYNLFWPAVIVGIALVLAALIYKNGEFRFRKEQKQVVEHKAEEKKPAEDVSEPYYKSDSNLRNP